MKRRNKILAGMLALVMAVSLTACGGGGGETNATGSAGESDEASSGGSTKDTLNIGINSDSSTLAPVYNSKNPGYAVYETLYYVDARTGDYVMQMAESVEITDDTHMTVKLKEGITDSAGQPFTADDVLTSIAYANTDTISAMYVPYIDLEASHVVDDLTVEIVLTETNVIQWIQLGDVRVFCQESMDASEDGMINNPVGTGPYVVTEYIPGSSIRMEARDDYWGEAPAIRYVNWIVISENAQRAIALESGEIDLCLDTAASDFLRFEGNESFATYQRAQVKDSILEFNCSENSICSDVRVRQAIAYAVDANAILNNVYSGLGEVTNGATSNTCIGFDPSWNEDYYSYNVDRAKELLAEAGIAEGTHLVLGNNGTSENSMIAEIVQSFMMSAGLDVEIVTYDNATWTSVRQDADSGIDVAVQVYSSPDGYYPGQIWSGVFTSGTNHYENQQLYDLVMEAMGTTDAAKQEELNRQINDIMVSELPGYGLVSMSSLYVWNASLQGVEEMAAANSRIIPSQLSFQ